MCLNVPESKTTPVQIIQYHCEPYGSNALWTLLSSNGAWKISNVNSGAVLEVLDGLTADGSVVRQYADSDGSNQRFSFSTGNPGKFDENSA